MHLLSTALLKTGRKPDNAYPVLLNLLPVGLKGLAFAALTAAIVASLAGKANSISTIYMLDIHNKFFDKNLYRKTNRMDGPRGDCCGLYHCLDSKPVAVQFRAGV